MKRLTIISALVVLLCTALVSGKGQPQLADFADSLRSTYLYTEGIKRGLIAGDTVEATRLFEQVIASDSSYAPAHYELATLLMNSNPSRATQLSQRAAKLDTTNKWYVELYGQALLGEQQFDKALVIYDRLKRIDPKNPDNYRILAALYEQTQLPFSAIAVLDSAELRFGRIPFLSAQKRRLLVNTRQFDKAVAETQSMVNDTPYDAENLVMLGELYGILGRDSLAQVAFSSAMQLDSTNLPALFAMADYYKQRQNYRAFLGVSRRIFESNEVPLKSKTEQFERITSDNRFYREYFLQINELASTLAIKHPNNPTVVELYGRHLIASGELESALQLYKHHTTDRPAIKQHFTMVIDIESYKQRPDSVEKYVAQALELFPNDPQFYIARGNIHSYGKRPAEAVKCFRAALRHITSDSLRGVVWGYIGDTYHTADEQKKSYAAYNKSLAYYRDNAMVLNNYAYFLALEGRELDRALEMSSRAVAITESNPTYLDTYAWVLYKLNRLPEAKKAIQLAVSLDRDKSPELFLHYGDILAAGGEKFLAEIYWRKALENGYSDPEAIARRFVAQGSPKPEIPTKK